MVHGTGFGGLRFGVGGGLLPRPNGYGQLKLWRFKALGFGIHPQIETYRVQDY